MFLNVFTINSQSSIKLCIYKQACYIFLKLQIQIIRMPIPSNTLVVNLRWEVSEKNIFKSWNCWHKQSKQLFSINLPWIPTLLWYALWHFLARVALQALTCVTLLSSVYQPLLTIFLFMQFLTILEYSNVKEVHFMYIS